MPDDDLTDIQHKLLEELSADPWEVQQYREGNFTDEDLHRRAKQRLVQQPPLQPTPRQAGKSNTLGIRPSPMQAYHPVEMNEFLNRLLGRGVLLWSSNHRFTYAAVGVHRKGANAWFITGEGGWYGKSEFTQDEMIHEVLAHPEVTSISFADTFHVIYGD